MLLTYLESLNIFLIKLVIILMILAKIAHPGLLKITVFWNKGYEVIISVNDVTNKILWHGSNYIADALMWLKFVTVAFLWEKLSQPQFYKDLTRITTFLEGWSSFKFNNYGLALGTNLKLYTSVGKGLKLKSQKYLGANSYICRSYWGKTGRDLFVLPSPSWVGLIDLHCTRNEFFQ